MNGKNTSVTNTTEKVGGHYFTHHMTGSVCGGEMSHLNA